MDVPSGASAASGTALKSTANANTGRPQQQRPAPTAADAKALLSLSDDQYGDCLFGQHESIEDLSNEMQARLSPNQIHPHLEPQSI